MSNDGPTQVQLPQSAHGSQHGDQSPAPGFPGVGARIDFDNESTADSNADDRSPNDEQKDAELANRLSSLIEDANRRVVPLCKMIRQVSR